MDTDSLTLDASVFAGAVLRGDIVLGEHYGDLRLETEYKWFQVVAPKAYLGITREGQKVWRSKGIYGSSFEEMEQVTRAYQITREWTTVTRTIDQLKGADRTTTTRRTYSTMAGSRQWVLDGDQVEPVTVGRQSVC
jgi:hypothetical protein